MFCLQVFVAGDDASARDLVSGVVRGAGFTPVDLGGLSSARTIEDIPVAVFPQWRVPFYIHLVIFIFLYILGFVKYQVSVHLIIIIIMLKIIIIMLKIIITMLKIIITMLKITMLKSIFTMLNFIFTDMLAYHMVHRWYLPMAPVEPHPHGQHEQDPGGARPDHPSPVLPAWCSSGVVADLPRYKVLQVSLLA
jgi:hypothetical protein